MSKRPRSPSILDPSSLASSSRVAHPLTVPASIEGPGDLATSDDFELQGDLDSEDWDEMIEAEQLAEDEEGSDVGEEEVQAELNWLQFEASHRPPQDEIDRMSSFLKERGLLTFIKTYVHQRKMPILHLLFAFDVNLPKSLRNPDIDDLSLLPVLRMALSRVLRRRSKLEHLNTWEQALDLIGTSKRILVLTGAGISVSCGIPDFRSSEGLYARLKEEGKYDLDDPQQMFDIHYFRENPGVFYSFASQIYPSNFVPSPCHRWIKLLEDKGKLLRNYTQNIDTLETQVGIQSVLQCHGSFATATCVQCKYHAKGSFIEREIMQQKVPMCPRCAEADELAETVRAKKRKTQAGGAKGKGRGKSKSGWGGGSSDEEEGGGTSSGGSLGSLGRGVMKPDITFFGEKLDDRFDRCLFTDREQVDLLIIIGSSLQVAPVSEVLAHLPHSIPQILINKTPVKHFQPDINLLGDADGIIQLISDRLGWEIPPPPTTPLQPPAAASLPPKPSKEPSRVGESHFWLFDGAEGGTYVEAVQRAYDESDEDGDDDEAGSEGEGAVGGEEEGSH